MNRSMTVSMNVDGITLDFGALSIGSMLVMALVTLGFRYFKLLAALLIAGLPKKYAKRVLKILKQLNDSSTKDEGGDGQSGTSRGRRSLKRT